MAKAYNRPVLVCCETYKFSDRMQLDSIVFNELGMSYGRSVDSQYVIWHVCRCI